MPGSLRRSRTVNQDSNVNPSTPPSAASQTASVGPPDAPETKPRKLRGWTELGRAIMAEATRRTTNELITRRCGKLRRAVNDSLGGGAH